MVTEIKSKLLVVEGSGGAGKTELTTHLEEYLKKRGINIQKTREPGGVEVAEEIRDLIFKLKETKSANADQIAALFMTARYFWMKQLINPGLQDGISFIADRSFPSTAVYQSSEGASMEMIDKMAAIVMQGIKPDLVIFLDVSPGVAMKRRANAEGDPFDKLGKRYFYQIVARYRELYNCNWGGLNWQRIDADQPLKLVFSEAERIVDVLYNLPNG
jgi:dTMP kinase